MLAAEIDFVRLFSAFVPPAGDRGGRRGGNAGGGARGFCPTPGEERAGGGGGPPNPPVLEVEDGRDGTSLLAGGGGRLAVDKPVAFNDHGFGGFGRSRSSSSPAACCCSCNDIEPVFVLFGGGAKLAGSLRDESGRGVWCSYLFF